MQGRAQTVIFPLGDRGDSDPTFEESSSSTQRHGADVAAV